MVASTNIYQVIAVVRQCEQQHKILQLSQNLTGIDTAPIVQELSDAAAVLAEGSLVGPLDRQRRLRWAERLQVTQSSLPTQVRPSVAS